MVCAHREAGLGVGADGDVGRLVLVDLGRVDVHVHYPRARLCEPPNILHLPSWMPLLVCCMQSSFVDEALLSSAQQACWQSC